MKVYRDEPTHYFVVEHVCHVAVLCASHLRMHSVCVKNAFDGQDVKMHSSFSM